MNDVVLVHLLYKFHLYDDSKTTAEYMDIINDYMIGSSAVASALIMAKEMERGDPGTDRHESIIYNLIAKGKEKSSYYRRRSQK